MAKQDRTAQNALRDLVDFYARARTAAKAAEKSEQALREQIMQQLEARGVDHLAGGDFEVERTVSVRETLDSKAVRLLLSPAQIEAVTRKTPVNTLSVKALGEVIGRAA